MRAIRASRSSICRRLGRHNTQVGSDVATGGVWDTELTGLQGAGGEGLGGAEMPTRVAIGGQPRAQLAQCSHKTVGSTLSFQIVLFFF